MTPTPIGHRSCPWHIAEAATRGPRAWSICARSASVGPLSWGLADAQPASTAQAMRMQGTLMTLFFFRHLRGVSMRLLPYIMGGMTQRNKCLDSVYALRYRGRVDGVATGQFTSRRGDLR